MSPHSRHSSAFGLQNGTSNDTRDAMRAAVVGGDNSVVMVGVSIGNYSQGDEWNAVAVKLDASGEQVWIWQVNIECFPILPLTLAPMSRANPESNNTFVKAIRTIPNDSAA